MRPFVSAAIWSVIAALGGWLLIRLLGLERGFPLVPILAYTPYVAAATPGAAGAGIYARYPLRRRPLPAVPGGFAMTRTQVRPPGAPLVEVVAVHPVPPAGPDAVDLWSRGLRSLPPAVPGTRRILAGDFNATLDHAALRAVLHTGYRDAAAFVGKAWSRPGPPVAGFLRSRSTMCSSMADAWCEA